MVRWNYASPPQKNNKSCQQSGTVLEYKACHHAQTQHKSTYVSDNAFPPVCPAFVTEYWMFVLQTRAAVL